MKANGTWKVILIMLVFCGCALGCLYLHATSIRLTRELTAVDTQRRLVEERIEMLKVELEQMKGFCRLESLWGASDNKVAERASRVELTANEHLGVQPATNTEETPGQAVAVEYRRERTGR